jgi:signal recognition particle subunit SRP54
MFETLTQGFRAGRDRFRGITKLTEENVAEALLEVRRSLLDADVDLAIVRQFLDQVKERCVGEQVRLRSGKRGQRVNVTPSDHFMHACYTELVSLMGEAAPLEPAKHTRVVLMVGLQGSGKTSTAAKLARHLLEAGERPLLVAADVYRPAAREQLKILGDQIGVPVFTRDTDDAAAICAEAVEQARKDGRHTVLLDTAGRLQIDEPLMQELVEIRERTQPKHILLVCDSMAGREAVHVARGFAERLPLDGLILSKLDGDARGGAALAIRAATGIPIRYVTLGEGTDRLEVFRPEGLASRVLGMGDVVSLMQDFERVTDAEQAEADAQRMLQGQFGFDDFLTQLRTLRRMGPLKDIMEKLPFIGDILPKGVQVEGDELRRFEAMILSMTTDERKRPELINASRQRRIARGSGRSVSDVSDLVQRFEMMRGMFGQLRQSGMLGRVPGGGSAGGGARAGAMPKMDPAQLQQLAMGMPPNRQAARAMKAEQKRTARKGKRKHQRRQKRSR